MRHSAAAVWKQHLVNSANHKWINVISWCYPSKQWPCVGQRAPCFPAFQCAHTAFGLHVWCPFMQTHSLLTIKGKDRQRESEASVQRWWHETPAAAISLLYVHQHAPWEAAIIDLCIPAANYIQRHPIITSSTSISTCCMNPSGLHNCRLSICLENTGYNVQGAARGREKQDSSRSPLLPFSTRWSNIHLPLALCWTFSFQTTTLLTLSNLHFHLNGRFKLVSSIFFLCTATTHLLTTARYSAGKHQHVCEDGDRRQDCYSGRRGCYLICNELWNVWFISIRSSNLD